MENSAKSAAGEKDLVCGMTVDPSTAKYRTEHDGQAYYFCCASCLEKFKSDPSRYLEASRASLPQARAGKQVINIAPAPAFKVGQTKPAFVPLAPLSTMPSRLREKAPTSVPCVPRFARPNQVPARSVGWRLSRRCRWFRPAWNIPAPCILKLSGPGLAIVPSAAWRWNREPSLDKMKRIQNYAR